MEFHLPHVRILGKNHCDEMRRTAFKKRKLFQGVLCRRDYAEGAFSRFSHQIQLAYYGGNISLSIEGIALEHFSELPQTNINSTIPSRKRHDVFHYF